MDHAQDSGRRRPLAALAATASLLVAGTVAVLRHRHQPRHPGAAIVSERRVERSNGSGRRSMRRRAQDGVPASAFEGGRTVMDPMDDVGMDIDIIATLPPPPHTDPINEFTTTTDAPAKPTKWWPVETSDLRHPGGITPVCIHTDDYPDGYLLIASTVLFDTEVECCERYECSPAGDSSGPEEYWYPSQASGSPSCVFGDDYPPMYKEVAEFATSFLFHSQPECCAFFPVACVGMFWHPNESRDGCVFDGDFMAEWNSVEGYLFLEEGGCCDVWCGGTTTSTTTTSTTTTTATTTTTTTTTEELTTTTTLEEDASTTTPEATTTTPTVDKCEDCEWHESTTAYHACTNSPEYPPAFEHAREYFFFRTPKECCQARFPDMCTVVEVDDVVSDAGSEFTRLGSSTFEDFDGSDPSLPFDMGSPPTWKKTVTAANSGVFSVTNIPQNGTSAIADLTLKISVSTPSTVSCMALIQTSMPYDYFSLWVDGSQRNTYYNKVEGGWMNVVTGIDAGESTVAFRVKNGDSVANLGPVRTDNFGTGRVWLDDCSVTGHGA